MQRSTFVWSAVLALLFLSLSVILPVAAATQYEGNDNFEFGCPSGLCGYGIPGQSISSTATLQSQLVYSSGDPEPKGPYVSLQYNPDKDASLQCQTGEWYRGHDWFQSIIFGARSSNCGIFSIEVYNSVYGEPWSWYSNGGGCTTVSNIFLSGARWEISEYTYACLTNCGSNFEKIASVSFSLVGGSGGGSYYLTENTPLNWYWLRSNVCWCGITWQNTVYNPTFSNGNGVLNYGVNSNIGIIGPPIDIGTAENSNMLYTCPSQSGNTITQAFELSYHC